MYYFIYYYIYILLYLLLFLLPFFPCARAPAPARRVKIRSFRCILNMKK